MSNPARIVVRMALVLILVAWPGAAGAAPSITLLASEDGCPSREAFSAALRTIFPDVRIDDATGAPSAEPGPTLRVELSNVASSYRVVAGELTRELTDPELRCEERARKAAVFVALVLAPPFVELPSVAPTAELGRPRDELPSVVAIAERRRPTVELELGGVVDAAPRTDSNSLVSAGAQLRVVLAWGWLGGTVGVTALSRTISNLPGVRAQLTRVPFDVGVRAALRRDRLSAALDAGLVAALLIAKGLDSPLGLESTRLELGLRLAARLEYRAWNTVAPFVVMQVELIPSSYDLVVPTAGVVGTTPNVWVAGIFGLAFAIL